MSGLESELTEMKEVILISGLELVSLIKMENFLLNITVNLKKNNLSKNY